MTLQAQLKQAAKKPVQKVKQASAQGSRRAQAAGGSLKDALTEDTGSTLGAAGIVGLAVVVAGAVVLGSEWAVSSDCYRGCACMHAGRPTSLLLWNTPRPAAPATPWHVLQPPSRPPSLRRQPPASLYQSRRRRSRAQCGRA